jgi:hypothetical protein
MTDRRSFLRGASVLMGHMALGQVMAAVAASPRKATFFSGDEMRTLQALVDTILPATDSPAASAAGTHFFIDLALPACASAQARETFKSGLAELTRGQFAQLQAQQQVAQLQLLADSDMAPPYDQSFFKILKDYTLTGYFLSEVGATQALAYERVPGGFQGDVPLAPDQKAWAI